MAETYSAGIVTAYGAAVRGGYTGTYEQFCAEQAQFGANAAKVAQDRAAVEAATETFTTETVPGAVQTVQQTGAAQVQAVEAASETEQQQIALAGAAQETRVTQAGDDQVDAVEEAGTTQVGNVNTAGTTQVGAVNTAGATQVQAVEDKGQEVIDSIPDDYTELTEDVSSLKSALEQLENKDINVPTEVRQAIFTIFSKAAYNDGNLADEKTILQSWSAEITSITLNQSSISIDGVNQYQLIATTVPTGGAITWSSSNDSVATVSSSGIVTGVGNGRATITASCGGKKATCSVAVSGFASLIEISAVYTQSGIVEETDSLELLKENLVVTAIYDDDTTKILGDSEYTLSGVLEVGTSTISVMYNNISTTFTVNVSKSSVIYTLNETVLTRNNVVDTNVTNSQLFTTEGATIFIDFEDTDNTNSADARVIFSTGGTNISQKSGKYNFARPNGGIVTTNILTNLSKRVKAVMRVQPYDGTVDAVIKFDYSVDGAIQEQLTGSSGYNQTSSGSNHMFVGGEAVGSTNHTWAGTIHEMKVYSKLLSDSNVAELLK